VTTPGRLTLTEEDRRILAPWAADCAERVLSIFEAEAPTDSRPRAAIDGLRAFGRGELKVGPARALSAAAHAAARSVANPAAVAAARAAGQAIATAHMGAHARGAPAYAALAASLAGRGPEALGGAAAGDREVRWAIDHASPEVRSALRKLPDPPRSAGFLGTAIARVHGEVGS
jgi:hypothetical protein